MLAKPILYPYLTERIEKLLNKIYQILQNEVKANVVAYLDVFDPF